MPQLNPHPWFAILAFAWLVFAIILPYKTSTFEFPNELSIHDLPAPILEPWNWPWL
uniref:ATP synthase complex subunit 8 n=1 Tax=Doratonotus megalepis TaxID=700792 RepID=A0A8E5I1E8_9LABR|nr:ATP synthase protein 8 [Doratonotus megalepis]WNH21716.1 ATP synthase F0 subunit 8 [Doratonotus megalepis]